MSFGQKARRATSADRGGAVGCGGPGSSRTSDTWADSAEPSFTEGGRLGRNHFWQLDPLHRGAFRNITRVSTSSSLDSSSPVERARPLRAQSSSLDSGRGCIGQERKVLLKGCRSPANATTRRTASADPPSLPELEPRAHSSSGFADPGEVQLFSKDFLQREIEARSQKISAVAQQRRWDRSSSLVNDGDVPELPRRKLFIVSARLPFTVIWSEETGTFECEKDPFEANIADLLSDSQAGSWVVGAQPVEAILVGAPHVRRKSDGSVVPVGEGTLQQELDRYLRTELKVVPVFPPPNRDRFADWVIFPLFHYSPPSVETGLGLYDWDGYELVSETFRDAVLQEYSRGDLVWINDYPLMLLPKLLRKERPDICIGFYIHCVFPSSEVYRILPQRENLLRGVLSSNIIGFHNFQYVRHFLTSCTRVLGLECTTSGIEACEDAGGTCTKVIAVPLGINLEPYHAILRQEETKANIRQLAETFVDKRILVAVDRLEEKKGIPHKIMAFHRFLQKAPAWSTQCVFVLIVEATEEAANEDASEGGATEESKCLLEKVYQMVGEVNSKFGSIGHLPFHFLCQQFNRVDVAALSAKAHVFIDTPLRDTLSPSAHKFLCCQEENECGVLILSEFSGSAQSLRAAALCVNPWDTNGFADAIQEALEMEPQDRMELHRYGNRYVNEYTLTHWATNFLDELQTAEGECETERLQIPPPLDHDKPVAAMRKANRRIVILGFCGTLLPGKSKIHAKILPKLPPALLGNLRVIAEDPNTHVVVISGFARHTVAQALVNVRCWIIAEGGVCYREPGSSTWHSSIEQRDNEWMGPVKEIMEYFAARTPGSNVIETSSSVSWHYQKTQGDHAAIQSKDLLIHLWAGPLLSAPAEVVVGNDSVSVRPTGVGKASQLEKVLQLMCCEEATGTPKEEWLSGDTMVICISDLITRDEDVFVAVQKFFEPEGSSEQRRALLRHEADADCWDGRESWVGSLEHEGRRCHGRLSSLHEREPNWVEEINLEANSKSLGDVYNRLSMVSSRVGQDDNDGLFGLFKNQSDDCPAMLKKTPSQSDLQASECNGNAPGLDQVMLFTCTVNRKATRAMYHLSDTNDVAFLIAMFAREMRQAKHAEHAEHAEQASGGGS